MILIVICVVLAINIYTLQSTVENLIIVEEISRNATQRTDNILNLKTNSLTDYAWHFNTGMKLDLMQEDINDIKNELGLADNITYARPTDPDVS